MKTKNAGTLILFISSLMTIVSFYKSYELNKQIMNNEKPDDELNNKMLKNYYKSGFIGLAGGIFGIILSTKK